MYEIGPLGNFNKIIFFVFNFNSDHKILAHLETNNLPGHVTRIEGISGLTVAFFLIILKIL